MEIRWQSELQMELNWVILKFIMPDFYLCFPYLKSGNNFSVDNLSLIQPLLVLLFLLILSTETKPIEQSILHFLAKLCMETCWFLCLWSHTCCITGLASTISSFLYEIQEMVTQTSWAVFSLCFLFPSQWPWDCSTSAYSMCSSLYCLFGRWIFWCVIWV